MSLYRIEGRGGLQPVEGIDDVVLDAAAIESLAACGRLPLPSGAARGIAVAALASRLPNPALAALLREGRRVLARAGVLRVAPGRADADLRGRIARLAALAGLAACPERAHGESAVPEFHDLDGAATGGGALEFVKPTLPLRGGPTPVSIVIPAYNPRYFEEALDSALAQTHPAVEVIVSDDDETGAIAALCERKRGERPVRHFRNTPRLGACRNYVRCFELASGEYVKFLNDDDRLQPDCVERMADVLDERPDVTLVTSHRRLIGAGGAPLGDIASTRRPVTSDAVLDGAEVAAAVVGLRRNFLGEPTTVLFRKADLAGASPSPLSFAGREYDWNVDVAMWLTLLARGDAAYLVASLSDFRLHPEQEQRRPDAEARGEAAWAQLRDDAASVGLLRPPGPVSVTVVGSGPGAARSRERSRHAAGSIDAARRAFSEALAARD